MIKILIYGHNGYIGSNLKNYLMEHNNVKILKSNFKKIKKDTDIKYDIDILKPDRIISCIGLVKKDNLFSTEFLNQNKYMSENIENNLYLHILISKICIKYNIHFTYIGTGCLYSSKNKVFFENDEPNFFNSNYSIVKGYTDKILNLDKDKILILRLRQCINSDNKKQNFLNKFLSFKKVSDIQNSYTVIPSIFPILSKLIIQGKFGIFNCVNKGSISVKEIVELFGHNDFIVCDKEEMYEKYSNCILSTEKLENLYHIENIKDAIIKLRN